MIGGAVDWRMLPVLSLAALSQLRADPPTLQVDLATPPAPDTYTRFQGAFGKGNSGVPVTGGHDCDGDGIAEVAFSAMTSSPFGIGLAGQVTLIWGTNQLGNTVDTSSFDSQFLHIAGTSALEACGSEIWMDDIDGDGLGDLLIGRQNFSHEGRRGVGALTVLFGSPALRAFSERGEYLNLAAPPIDLPILTITGRNPFDRLGIWMRTGDVDGDGIQDLALGADEADRDFRNSGEVYVIRGGPHLREESLLDLRFLADDSLAEHVARVLPPQQVIDMHFGATVQLGDLDNDGRAELIVAATVDRAGAAIRLSNAPGGTGQSQGGFARGRAFIVWDEWFSPEVWNAPGYEILITNDDANVTTIGGGSGNVRFGEEMLAGGDFDGDGRHDIMFGDLIATGSQGAKAGSSAVFFNAASLRGRRFSLDTVPEDVRWTFIDGPVAGALSGDSAGLADFDGDGLDDLVISHPHDNPGNRLSAGSLHILYGNRAGWPSSISLAANALPPSSQVRSVFMAGARGSTLEDLGDTLAYSLDVGDVTGDGIADLIFNEMLGNGAVRLDTGNLMIYSGSALLPPPNMVPPESLVVRTPSAEMTRLSWQSFPRLVYRVETSIDLQRWLTIGENLLGTGGVLTFEDQAPPFARRLYRIVSEIR